MRSWYQFAAAPAAAVLGVAAHAQQPTSEATNRSEHNRVRTYDLTITNITRGPTFTPMLVASHSPRVAFFELGARASTGLATLAEDGSPAQLAAALAATGEALDAQTIPGLLAPGASAVRRSTRGLWR